MNLILVTNLFLISALASAQDFHIDFKVDLNSHCDCTSIISCPLLALSFLKAKQDPIEERVYTDYLKSISCGYEELTPKVCCPPSVSDDQLTDLWSWYLEQYVPAASGDQPPKTKPEPQTPVPPGSAVNTQKNPIQQVKTLNQAPIAGLDLPPGAGANVKKDLAQTAKPPAQSFNAGLPSYSVSGIGANVKKEYVQFAPPSQTLNAGASSYSQTSGDINAKKAYAYQAKPQVQSFSPAISSYAQEKPVVHKSNEIVSSSGYLVEFQSGFNGNINHAPQVKSRAPAISVVTSPSPYIKKESESVRKAPTTITSHLDVDTNVKVPTYTGCGKSLSRNQYFNNITEISDFPWLAFLEYQTPQGKKVLCSGALITDRHVLTAARCVSSYKYRLLGVRLGVRLGEAGCADCPPSAPVDFAIPHERYIPGDSYVQHDIALLRLRERLAARPVCLPEGLSGSGYLVPGRGGISRLRDLGRACGTADHICTGRACAADAGAPLLGYRASPDGTLAWSVLGVAEMDQTCDQASSQYGLFTRVYDYVPWIKSKLQEYE